MEIAETYMSVRISELTRSGLSALEPAQFNSYEGETKVGSFQVEVRSESGTIDRLYWDEILVYFTDRASVRMVQPVYIAWTDCNFGGWRAWFVCPGCQRRCQVLYIWDDVLCRICHGLVYESQTLQKVQRRVIQIGKRRKKVGGTSDIMSDFPPKPKGMHWSTYEGLWQRDKQELDQHFGEATADLDAFMERRSGGEVPSAPDSADPNERDRMTDGKDLPKFGEAGPTSPAKAPE